MPPDSFRVELSEAATADLIAIEDWLVEQADADTATAYVERIIDRIAALDHFPSRGTPHPELGPEIRSISFERRIVIVYQVEIDYVSIRRVIDGARDLTGLIV